MPRAVAVAPDGWIVTGGSQTTPTIAPWFARISVSGEAVWTETTADADIGSSVQALVVDDDGLIHAAGGTTYDDSSGAAWFARLDASGATHDAASFVIGDYTRAEGVALGPGPAWYVGGEAGTYAASLGIEQVLCLGELSAYAAAACAGARHVSDVDALLAAVDASVTDSRSVLVKGSRFMRMERVVEHLAARALSSSKETSCS